MTPNNYYRYIIIPPLVLKTTHSPLSFHPRVEPRYAQLFGMAKKTNKQRNAARNARKAAAKKAAAAASSSAPAATPVLTAEPDPSTIEYVAEELKIDDAFAQSAFEKFGIALPSQSDFEKEGEDDKEQERQQEGEEEDKKASINEDFDDDNKKKVRA